MKKLISFIIPAYNAERYIERCVSRILNIGIEDLEVIVVDDGSTDDTFYICEKIQDSRIRVIRQKNSGVSAARNKGALAATGEYLTFIDSDDCIKNTEYMKIIDYIKKYSPDLIMYDYDIIEGKKITTMKVNHPSGHYSASDCKALRNRLIDYKYSANLESKYMGGKVYQYVINRRILGKNVKFQEGFHYAEDMCFCWDLLNETPSIDVLHCTAYEYYVYNNSAAHRYRKEYWHELMKVYDYICSKKGNENPTLKYSYMKEALIHYIYRTPNFFELYKNIKYVMDSVDLKSLLLKIQFENWTIREKQENWFVMKRHYLLYILYEEIYRAYKKLLRW